MTDDLNSNGEDKVRPALDGGRIVFGVMLAITALPFALYVLAAMARGEMRQRSDILMSGTLSIFLIGTTVHFFIGQRFPKLLPSMVGLLGAGMIALGGFTHQWPLARGGGVFLAIASEIWPTGNYKMSRFLRALGSVKQRTDRNR